MRPLRNEVRYNEENRPMFKIIRSAMTLVGSWLGVRRLKVVVGAALDIENVSPLGLLRGHLHDSRDGSAGAKFSHGDPDRNTPVNPFPSRAAESRERGLSAGPWALHW